MYLYISQEEVAPKYDKIGGWLFLVAIGMVLTPIRLSTFILKDVLPAFNKETWTIITTPGSEVYHPLFGPLMIGELITNVLFLIFSIVVAVLFFQRKKIVPKLTIILYITYFVFLVVDYFVTDLVPFVAAQDDSDTERQIIQTFFTCAIWVPYFIVSKRVKGTFVK